MHTKNPFVWLFVAGCVAGILYLNLQKSVLLQETDLWDSSMIEQLEHMSLQFQGSALFASVFYRRGIHFIELSVLATTYLGTVVCFGAATAYGFVFGSYLASAVLRNGWRGALLALAGILPQGILYGFWLFGLLNWCRKTYAMIYGRDRGQERGGQNGIGRGGRAKTPVLVERVLSWLILALLLAVGCALESYVNPVLLEKMTRILF